jgi:HPt (histidine-containing phosphotransfer) domain-containing protein
MPEMDGLAATTELRRREGPVRHTPVIAMTAYAMRGDRESGLAAGMDDYITKPVGVRALHAALQRWLPIPAAPPRDQPPDWGGDGDEEPDAVACVLDPLALRRLQELGLDLHTVLPTFLDETRLGLNALRDALERGDARTVADSAHRLKGAATLVGAAELRRLAAELEAAGRDAALAPTAPLFDALHPAFQRTREAVQAALIRDGATA